MEKMNNNKVRCKNCLHLTTGDYYTICLKKNGKEIKPVGRGVYRFCKDFTSRKRRNKKVN